MKHASKTALLEVAKCQSGFFTAQQAVSAGYLSKNHTYHVHQGHWIREYRGIYRLSYFPSGTHDELILWSLWSSNRAGLIQGVYSHETALQIYEVSDVLPSQLNMTVPKTFRRLADIPTILTLHYSNLSSSDIIKKDGYSITTPYRTLDDLIQDSTDDNIIEQALKEFRKRGLITERQLVQLITKHPFLSRYILGSSKK